MSCGRCVRGLLCGPCNDVLAVARDDWYYFSCAIDYLSHPPAKKVLDAAMPRVPEGSQGDDGGQVVPASGPEDEKEVRRERNHGSGTEAIPGVDHYVDDLAEARRRQALDES